MSCVYLFDNGTTVPMACNDVVNSVNFLTGEIEYNQYGYNITTGAALAFTILFGLSFIAHIAQAIRYRFWWCLYTLALGGALECIGWIGRLLSAYQVEWNPNNGGLWSSPFGDFIMQICLLIISPAFLSAACYITLGRLIAVTSTDSFSYSRITARSYTIVFIFGDIVSLVIQGSGGGIAGTANTSSGADNGAYIMVGGVCFQLVIMAAYTLVLSEFVYRYQFQKPLPKSRQINLLKWTHWKLLAGPSTDSSSSSQSSTVMPMRSRNGSDDTGIPKSEPFTAISSSATATQEDLEYMRQVRKEDKIGLMIIASVVATILIFIRSIFRSIELSNGWRGRLATDQTLFNFLDGMLMLMAWVVFNIAHPGFCIKSYTKPSKTASSA